MRLTWRDAVATVLTAGGVAIYVAYILGAELPLLDSPRTVAATVLALGFLACNVGAPAAFRADSKRWILVVGSTLGVAILIAGLVALITGSPPALAALVVTTVALWAFTTARHAISDRPEPPVGDAMLEQHKDHLPPRLTVS